MTRAESQQLTDTIKAYCLNKRTNITVHGVAAHLREWDGFIRYRLNKLCKVGFLRKVFAGSGTDSALYEVADEAREIRKGK